KCEMKVFREYSQCQGLLLPPSLEEFVPDDHEARIINEVVDAMNLSPLLVKYEGGGAPAYHPGMMLKVIIYAYSRDIYSSRSIAQELQTDTAFMFLSGLQSPDFRTICLFRTEHADVLPTLFVEVVRLCASLGMVGLGHIAFDGTKLKANASVKQTRDREGLEKEIERIKGQMRQMIESSSKIDELEDLMHPDGDGSEIATELRKKEYRLKKLQEAMEVLEREKLEKVNVTEPDSRLMKDSRGVIQPSHNGQIAVDDKDQVIVAADVSQNATDHAEFEPMVEQVERNLRALPDKGTADAGYSSYDNLEYAERKKLDMYMPDNFLEALDEKEEGEKRYHKSNFRYDEARDIYICPEGKELKRWTEQKREGKSPLIVYRGQSCRECPVRERCTRGETRTVSRDGREPLLEAMRQKLRSEEGKQIYKKRGYTVEPVFGEIKWDGRKPSMDLRGSVKVRGEFSLMCLVHNIKKIVKRVLDGTVS
ncbi:MAG: IS1182 family transposase, partial [Deltaproteobacteria bacterium]|nr:IS1182 family transposase [Deltaproteobacteria bacterium]